MKPGLNAKTLRQMKDVDQFKLCTSNSLIKAAASRLDSPCSGALRSLQLRCRVARGFEMRCRPLCDACVEALRLLVCMVPSEDISDARSASLSESYVVTF